MIKKIGLSLLTLTVLSTGLFAKADKALVSEYMDISGSKITIESMGEQITTGLAQTSMMYGEKVDEKKVAFLKTVFDADNGVEIVESYLVKNFDNSELKNIIAYYKSPLGKKVTQTALDAINPSAQADMYRFLADLQSNPPSKRRTAVIKTLIEKLQMVESMENVFAGLIAYLNTEASMDKKLSSEKIAQLESMMHQAFSQQMFVSALFIYRDISNQELEKVIKFYETPSGKNEIWIVTDAMSEMLKLGFFQAMKK